MPGMGDSSQTTTSQNSTQPWATAMPTVNSLFGQLNGLIPNSGLNSTEQGAINQLTANGQAGNPYAAGVGSATTNLLNGGGATSQNGALSSNLASYDASMAPYAASGYSTLNTPAVQNALNQIGTDTTDQINSEFAAAGRSGSGENAQTLGRGIAAAEAPLILNQANQDTATNLGAINSIYGAGNTTSNAITGNNQLANTNTENGITAAPQALSAENWGPQTTIQAQELQNQIPAQNLGMLSQIGIPLAGLGTQSNGTSTTQYDPSMLSTLSSLGGLFSSGAGGTSAAQGLANMGGGLLNGLSGLLAI